jgi:hypothetical protein
MENVPPMGADTHLPIRRESRFSMDLMSSSLGISDDLQLSRKLLASISAWKKLGGYAGDVIFQPECNNM